MSRILGHGDSSQVSQWCSTVCAMSANSHTQVTHELIYPSWYMATYAKNAKAQAQNLFRLSDMWYNK